MNSIEKVSIIDKINAKLKVANGEEFGMAEDVCLCK